MSSAISCDPARRNAVETTCQSGCSARSSASARPSKPDAPSTATLNMCAPRSATGRDGITGLVDGGLQRFGRLRRIDRDAARSEIDADLRRRVVFANGIGDCRDAMLATHAFYLK